MVLAQDDKTIGSRISVGAVDDTSKSEPIFNEISSFPSLFFNPKENRTYVLDIDETLLLLGVDKYKDKPALTEPALVHQLKVLRESGHQVILITASGERYQKETVFQLDSLGVSYDVILHAPHRISDSGEKLSTKGEVLLSYLQGLPFFAQSKIALLLVIDNEKRHLELIYSALSDETKGFQVPLFLYHYNADARLMHQYEDNFSLNVNALKKDNIKSLGGGTQSTYEVDIDGTLRVKRPLSWQSNVVMKASSWL